MRASSAGRATWPGWWRSSRWWRCARGRAGLSWCRWPGWVGERQPGELGGGAGAWAGRGWRAEPGGWRRAGVRRRVGGGGLGGVPLGFAEFGDGFGERGQSRDEHDRGYASVAGQAGECGQQPGGLAKLVPGPRRWRDAAVGWAGGAVVGVGGLAQDAAAEHGGGHVQGVGGGPGSVGGGRRIGRGQVADLRCGVGSDARSMLPDRVSLLGGQSDASAPGAARYGVHRCRSLGQLRSAASLPPPYQRGPLSLVVSPGRATEYPVT